MRINLHEVKKHTMSCVVDIELQRVSYRKALLREREISVIT